MTPTTPTTPDGRPIHGYVGDDLGLRTIETQYHKPAKDGGKSTSGIPWVPSRDYTLLAEQLKREREEMHGFADALARELEQANQQASRLITERDRVRTENAVLANRLDDFERAALYATHDLRVEIDRYDSYIATYAAERRDTTDHINWRNALRKALSIVESYLPEPATAGERDA